jgi:DNA polymerase delta subunit 1
MFGVTEEGNSVAAHVHNFTAYFYVHIIEQHANLGPVEIENFRDKLNKSVQSGSEAVIQIEQVEKYPCMNYQQEKQKFLKIYVSHPRFVSQLRAVIEKGI